MVLNFRIFGTRTGQKAVIDSSWKRMIGAVSLSIVVHIAIALIMRPDYKPVADRAVDFNVLNVTPGPPNKGIKDKPELSKSSDKLKTDGPATLSEIGPGLNKKVNLSKTAVPVAVDGGERQGADGGTSDDNLEVIGPKTPGTGVCMPNLFPFARSDATWVLWVSVLSFRETSLQDIVGSTLLRFGLGSYIEKATDLDYKKNIEGVLVTAGDIFSWPSYRVIIGYDLEEAKLRESLEKNLAGGDPIKWMELPHCMTGEKGDSLWHMAGSGRVLVADRKEPGLQNTGACDYQWPVNVDCISENTSATEDISPPPIRHSEKRLVDLAKSLLTPDKSGRWPVALLTTSDPRSVGLGQGRQAGVKFEHVLIRAFFSDPITIEGQVRFSGSKAKIKALAKAWRKIAADVSRDPFFVMSGLSSLFNGLTIKSGENTITFSLMLTEGQVKAGLLFLQLQGDVIERSLRSK